MFSFLQEVSTESLLLPEIFRTFSQAFFQKSEKNFCAKIRNEIFLLFPTFMACNLYGR
jgi:hypothetical protein